MDEYLAEIIGLLCAEGSYILQYSTYYGYDRNKLRLFRNHKSERIEFYNKDNKLLLHYKKLLLLKFNYDSHITKNNKINICNRKIIQTILGYTKLGHLKWEIPKDILNSRKSVKLSFIWGYFDGDGTCVTSVRMFSTNKKGLSQVSKILTQLDIKHTLQKPILKENRKPIYTLQVSHASKETFLKEVKPISILPGARINSIWYWIPLSKAWSNA